MYNKSIIMGKIYIKTFVKQFSSMKANTNIKHSYKIHQNMHADKKKL